MKKYIKPSVKAVAVSMEGMVCTSPEEVGIYGEQDKSYGNKYGAWSKEDMDDDDFLW